MSKIYINDLLHFNPDELDSIKIKLNKSNGIDDPMELYQRNPEIVNTQWFFWRKSNRYFKVGEIAVCFVKLANDTWLLTTIKKVTKDLDIKNGINYEGYELDEYKKYYGRVIVKFHKTYATQGVYYKKVCNEMEVTQILPDTFDGYDFPGYDKVCLSFKQLAIIVHQHKKDWISALENQKAVYLITDKNTGKLYVGSATSNNGMLLQRWKNYVENGHGGNAILRNLIDEKGFDYIKENFQYSILENYNAKIDDHVILQRESWWKNILQTRKFGYNAN
ncbi:MAG: GIY-YIG nuclease family protein [Hominimerdicola sp.]